MHGRQINSRGLWMNWNCSKIVSIHFVFQIFVSVFYSEIVIWIMTAVFGGRRLQVFWRPMVPTLQPLQPPYAASVSVQYNFIITSDSWHKFLHMIKHLNLFICKGLKNNHYRKYVLFYLFKLLGFHLIYMNIVCLLVTGCF